MTVDVRCCGQVNESRGGMFASAGYGVMPEISKWESRIKGMANWLLDADACPTTNEFIISERDRLNEIADGAEDGAQMAVWAGEQYVCELGACAVREPGEQPSDQISELHACCTTPPWAFLACIPCPLILTGDVDVVHVIRSLIALSGSSRLGGRSQRFS